MALNTTQLERYYNAPIGEVHGAVKHYLESGQSRFALKNVDDLSCSCTFSSGISMTTWGENLTASAVPSGEGTLVRLTVAGRLGSTAAGFQNSHNIAIADEFFSGVSETLSANRSVEASKNPEPQMTPKADVTLFADSAERQQQSLSQENPMASEREVDATGSLTSAATPVAAEPDAPVNQENHSAKVRTIWEKHKVQIIIAAIVVAALVSISVIVSVVSRSLRSEERLSVIQEVVAACNRNNKIKVLSDGDYSDNPALQMVWSSIPDREILECIAANTGMSEKTIDTIGYSSSSKDNSSAQWNDWKAVWTLDDDTMYATITVQYLGDDGSSFKKKATIAEFTNNEDQETGTTKEESEPQPFTISLVCYVTSGDMDLSTHTERIDGVTSQNYRDTVWKSGKSVSCNTDDKDSEAAGEKSTTDYEALKAAYGDRADNTEYGMGVLYSECASTSFIQMGMQTMSEGQAKELLGALVLCPDHPRAEEIRQKAGADTARLTEIQSKRQQGLIKDDGTYKVPSEMSTGTWKTMSEKVTNCYWEMQDANGQIYDNNFVSSGIAQTITIPNGVAGFSSQGCGAWEKQ